MLAQLTPLAAAYVRATNNHDAAGFIGLFNDDAVVDDNGRTFRGRDAIAEWAASDIFAVNVTLEVLAETEVDGQTLITSKVDGTFDRTGLPDPVIISHRLQTDDGGISALTCRLAEQPA